MRDLSVKKWPCYQNNIRVPVQFVSLFIFKSVSYDDSILVLHFCFVLLGLLCLLPPASNLIQTHTHTQCMRHSYKYIDLHTHTVMHRLM